MINRGVASVAVLCVAVMVFNFMPSGASSIEVISGYESTQSYAASTQAELTSDRLREILEDPNTDLANDKYIASLGEAIANYGVQVCITYGSGDRYDQKTPDIGHILQYCGVQNKSTGVWSKCSICGSTSVDYNASGKQFDDNLFAAISGEKTCAHGSCAAFASYCWWKYLGTAAPFSASSSTIAISKFKANGILGGDGSGEYIIANAKPGDMLVYTSNGGASYKHTELYVGPITVDIEGKNYTYSNAIVGMNWMDADCTLKEFKAGSDKVYLCPLVDWLRVNGIEETEVVVEDPDDALDTAGSIN